MTTVKGIKIPENASPRDFRAAKKADEEVTDYNAVLYTSSNRTLVLYDGCKDDGSVVTGNHCCFVLNNDTVLVCPDRWFEDWFPISKVQDVDIEDVKQFLINVVENGEQRDENGNVIPVKFLWDEF